MYVPKGVAGQIFVNELELLTILVSILFLIQKCGPIDVLIIKNLVSFN